jgi:peptidoglycan/xylan/chitin deacetylase (PgdA/CDA1 family)
MDRRSQVASKLACRVLLSTLLVVVALPHHAGAAGWPTPAAGRSASKGPELLLTFDDGPNPRTTPQVLDILKQRNIKALFFIVGEMVKNNKKGQELIRRIEAEGHIVANHTMTHQDLCRVPEANASSDIDNGLAAIEEVSRGPVLWFRAPYGVRCVRLETMLAARNTSHFHWDLDPQEWKNKNAQTVFDYVTNSIKRSSDRNVLLLHDVKEVTVEVLPQILDWIDAQNKEREDIGKKPIRIIPPSLIAAEQLSKRLAGLNATINAQVDVAGWIAAVLP